MPSRIEISYKTILFVIGTLALIWFLLEIKEIVLLLFLAFILMSALHPLVENLERRKIPRVVSILSIYIIFILLLVMVGGAVIPGLVVQTVNLWEQLPTIFNKILPFIPLNFEVITQQLTPISGDLLRVTLGFFSNIFNLLTLLILTFYLLLERQHLEETFKSLLGEQYGAKAIRVIWKIEDRLGAWVRGQIILMFIIGLFSFIGLTALGVNYALPLALLVGLFEIVPIVGSIIASVPAIIVALATSPILALAVLALYFIIHQSEGNFIVPTVMKKAVGLPPIVTLVALLVGAKIDGIPGALLAVPIVVTIHVLLQEYFGTSNS